MKYLALYVAISFIGIAVLGFTGLTRQDSLFSKCVEATIPGGLPCDGQDMGVNSMQAAIYQGFSAAVAATVFALAIAVVIFASSHTAHAREQIFAIASKLEAKSHSIAAKRLHWSSLHEQHPARA